MATVTIDAVKYKRFLEHLGLDTMQIPSFVIHKMNEDVTYNQGISGAVPASQLIEFARAYVAGELRPSIKSEAIPERNDEPVKVVVGNSWDSIVMDTGKDVMIEQYAVHSFPLSLSNMCVFSSVLCVPCDGCSPGAVTARHWHLSTKRLHAHCLA